MRSYKARMDKLEEAVHPQRLPPFVQAIMDYDEGGHCTTLELQGRTFTPRPGESEDTLCERAKHETGCADRQLVVVQLVRAADGKPAPGFERFAK